MADADNVPSQRVIEANGGTLVERFPKPAADGRKGSLRSRVRLDATLQRPDGAK